MDAHVKHGQKPSGPFFDEPLRCAIECDTGCASSHQRFEFFRSWHSEIVDVGLRCGDAVTFEAQEKIWALWPAMWAWTPNNLLARRKRVTTLDLSPGNFYDLSTVKVSG